MFDEDICSSISSKNGHKEAIKETNLRKIKLCFLFYALPFFYGAITRLPFIYFVIHMRFHFNLAWEEIGIFVGSYHAAQMVMNFAAMFLPKISHFVGTSLGLAGSILVLVKSNDDKQFFLLGTIAIGFSETLAASQTFLKNSQDINHNFELISNKIKVQYASVMLGVTFAFLAGGFVYDEFGINGIAIFGIVMSLCQLSSLLFYLILDSASPDMSSRHTCETNDSDICIESVAVDDSPEDDVLVALDQFSTSGIGANYINYILVITFGMESITIGYNLAISPIFIFEEFDKSPAIIGMMLAAGAAVGTCFSIYMTLSQNGQLFLKSYFPSPYDLFITLGGISLSVFLAAVPYFSIHLIGLLFLMAFNDMGAVILNEIQGTITSSQAYSIVGPMCQVARRFCNVITAITGPLLYGIYSRLPYIIAGSVSGIWLIVLAIVILMRMKKNQIKLASDPELMQSISEHGINFTNSEIVKRVCKEASFRLCENED